MWLINKIIVVIGVTLLLIYLGIAEAGKLLIGKLTREKK